MLKIVIFLLLCTGVFSLLLQNYEETVNNDEIKEAADDIKVRAEKEVIASETNIPNEEVTETPGTYAPDEKVVTDTTSNEIKPKTKKKKKVPPPALNLEQINMLAEKVIRIHGVDPNSLDEDNKKNIEQLRKIVAGVEKNLNDKLIETFIKGKTNPNTNTNSQVEENKEPILSEVVNNQNDLLGKETDTITDDNTERTTTNNNNVETTLDDKEFTVSNTKENDSLDESNNLDQHEFRTGNVENKVDTTTDDILESDNTSKRTINEIKNEEKLNTEREGEVISEDENIEVEIESDYEEEIQNESANKDDFEIENELSNASENIQDVQIDTTEYVNDNSLNIITKEDSDDISTTDTDDETDYDNIKNPEKRNDNIEYNANILENNDKESEEQPEVVVSDTCNSLQDCDQIDPKHMYLKEHNEEKNYENEIEKDIEDTHFQRLIKYVTSFLD